MCNAHELEAAVLSGMMLLLLAADAVGLPHQVVVHYRCHRTGVIAEAKSWCNDAGVGGRR